MTEVFPLRMPFGEATAVMASKVRAGRAWIPLVGVESCYLG